MGIPPLVLRCTSGRGCVPPGGEAIAAAQKACELSGRITTTVGVLALEYGRAGRRSEAQALLRELMARRRAAYVLPVALIAAYMGLGEIDQAIEWAEKGVEERDLLVVGGLKLDPAYADLRGHPRYQALLRKMNIED